MFFISFDFQTISQQQQLSKNCLVMFTCNHITKTHLCIKDLDPILETFFFCSECRKDNQTCFHCVLISVEMFKSISSQRRDTDIYWKPTLFYFSGACLFSSKTSRTVNKCRAQSQTCMVSIK